MATVYRIQDAEGRGPWKPGFSDKWVEDRPEDEFAALAPWPVEFPGLQLRRGFHIGCGCNSIRQLRRWFTESEYETLLKHGYQCVRMHVDRIAASSAVQVVFERSKPLAKNVAATKLY